MPIFRFLGTAACGAALGALGTISVAATGYLNKDRELDIEMVRVSLNILSGEAKEDSEPGRRFALRTLSKYSGVDIPEAEFSDWVKGGTIPKPAISPDLCGQLAVAYVEALKSNSSLTVGGPIKQLMESLGCFPKKSGS